jgi:hypothetical protein
VIPEDTPLRAHAMDDPGAASAAKRRKVNERGEDSNADTVVSWAELKARCGNTIRIVEVRAAHRLAQAKTRAIRRLNDGDHKGYHAYTKLRTYHDKLRYCTAKLKEFEMEEYDDLICEEAARSGVTFDGSLLPDELWQVIFGHYIAAEAAEDPSMSSVYELLHNSVLGACRRFYALAIKALAQYRIDRIRTEANAKLKVVNSVL